MSLAIRSCAIFTSLLIGASLACQTGGGGNVPRGSVVIQINNESINPKTAQVKAGGSVVWTNFSTYTARVAFPMSIMDGLTCTEIRPDFFKTADEIKSIPIRGGTLDLVLPCPLKPGVYDYTANLFSGQGTVDDINNPQLRIPGRIVVK